MLRRVIIKIVVFFLVINYIANWKKKPINLPFQLLQIKINWKNHIHYLKKKKKPTNTQQPSTIFFTASQSKFVPRHHCKFMVGVNRTYRRTLCLTFMNTRTWNHGVVSTSDLRCFWRRKWASTQEGVSIYTWARMLMFLGSFILYANARANNILLSLLALKVMLSTPWHY